MGNYNNLEQVGTILTGDKLDVNPQTLGGQTDYVFSRMYKIRASSVSSYLFQILSPASRITDDTITDAYLVKQRVVRLDEVNCHLLCTFAQIPSTWSTDYSYQNVGMPGVDLSSLYTPLDFDFRSSVVTPSTQVRMEHAYFLGPPNGIATYALFRPVDAQGLRVSVLTDNSEPSADEYISMVNGRQEIVVESVVLPFIGDIWDRRTKFALAK